MSIKLRHLLFVLAWAAVAYGLLWLGGLPGTLEHSLCGPWGCLPPLQALAALHALWLWALIPAVAFVTRRWPPARLRLLGGALLLAGLVGLTVLALREAAHWLPTVPDEYRRHFPKRVLFATATLTDLPLVQVTLAGAVCLLASRFRPEGWPGPPPA